MVPFRYPMNRLTFNLLFQKLFPVHYNIISTFRSVSVSRYSTFNMKNDFGQEEIAILESLGSGTFGKVVHVFSKTKNTDLTVKEFKEHGLMLEFVALKAINHQNIVKIISACQRKVCSRISPFHGVCEP